MEQKEFFDLKAYFGREIDRLSVLSKVKKTTEFNGKKEEQFLDKINLAEELKSFIEADINRTAWIDKYEADSVYNYEVLEKISYKANDPKLRTKELIIQFESGQVSHISIQKASGNFLTQTTEQLVYNPNQGYTLQSKQKLILFEDRVLSVDVKFKD